MARISVNGNASVVAPPQSGGLQVVFGGVEAYEVRSRELLNWRKALAVATLGAMVLLSAGVWAGAGRGEVSPERTRLGVIVTGSTALYLIWILRQVGVVWRFDHKRKTITRRHWMRGMSRDWKSGQVAGVRILSGKSRIGHEVMQMALVDRAGQLVAEVGRWDTHHVDRTQVESVMREIKTVMWWK